MPSGWTKLGNGHPLRFERLPLLGREVEVAEPDVSRLIEVMRVADEGGHRAAASLRWLATAGLAPAYFPAVQKRTTRK